MLTPQTDLPPRSLTALCSIFLPNTAPKLLTHTQIISISNSSHPTLPLEEELAA